MHLFLVDGGWSLWEAWTECTITCGNPGIQSRLRSCSNPSPEHNGEDCLGDTMEETNCPGVVQCPIDGNWSVWTQWGDCDASCGSEGHISRLRNCNSPAPQFNGLECEGEALEENSCPNSVPCPGNQKVK